MGAGISIVVDVSDLGRAEAFFQRLSTFEAGELMTGVGALGESQTRRRIQEEKTAPDGSAWPANKEGTPILVRSGEHLLGSLGSTASAAETEWGASWEHAHVHQTGMVITPKNGPHLSFMLGGKLVHAKKVSVPPRPFIGISAENAEEIQHLITDVFGGLVR
jgi:phage gpG-like protein